MLISLESSPATDAIKHPPGRGAGTCSPAGYPIHKILSPWEVCTPIRGSYEQLFNENGNSTVAK